MKHFIFACIILILFSTQTLASDNTHSPDYWYAWTQEHLAAFGYPKRDDDPPMPVIEIVSHDALKKIAEKYNKAPIDEADFCSQIPCEFTALYIPSEHTIYAEPTITTRDLIHEFTHAILFHRHSGRRQQEFLANIMELIYCKEFSCEKGILL